MAFQTVSRDFFRGLDARSLFNPKAVRQSWLRSRVRQDASAAATTKMPCLQSHGTVVMVSWRTLEFDLVCHTASGLAGCVTFEGVGSVIGKTLAWTVAVKHQVWGIAARD